MLRLRGQGRLPHPAGLRLVEVGEAVLNDRVLFGDFLAPTDNALADAEVSPSVARCRRLPPAAAAAALPRRRACGRSPGLPRSTRIYRSYAWVAPLRPGEPRLWEVDDLAAGVAQARSELQSVTSSFDLVAPVEELREAQATSRAAGRRLGIVGGEAAALLFAFALLAAMTLRTDLAAARRRLAWYGARGWQLALVTVAESGALALAGTAIGLAVGTVGGAVVAQRAGAPVWRRARPQRPLVRRAWAGAARRCSPRPPSSSARSRRGQRARVRAPGCGGACRDRPRRARARARRVANGDLTLLLPALVTFAAAVLVARLLRPALRVVERLARGRSPSLGLRLASLSLARNPGYAVVATAFLVVSFGLALFAESYRATLVRGERDQAAHRVPLDYLVREDLRRLIPVQDAASFERFGDGARRRRLAGAPADRRRRPARGRERDHAARHPARGARAASTAGATRTRTRRVRSWRGGSTSRSTLAGVRLSKELTVLRGRTLGGERPRLRRDRGAGRPLLPSSARRRDSSGSARRQAGGHRARARRRGCRTEERTPARR